MTLAQERWKTWLVGILLIISLAAVIFQSLSFTRVLRIDQNPSFPVSAIDDRSNNGSSTSSISLRDGKLILSCDIRASSFAWPYCELNWDLSKSGTKGTDLSRYSQVKLWVKYSSPQDIGIRFQSRNFNPKYARLEDEGSLKYNTIEFYKHEPGKPVIVPLSSFQVPTWWLVANAISPELSAPEYTNLLSIQLATGNNIKPGHYEIEVTRIEFEGKLFSDSLVYLTLLALWACLGLIYVFKQWQYIRRELYFSGQRQKELEALNRLLNIKSKNLEEKLSRDPLTGVLNRQGIAYLFEPGFAGQRPLRLSLIFIDIDYFKQVNDTHGHPVGDQVLVNFAEILRLNTRDADVLARWGGEEFVIACPNTDLIHAGRLAEKLRSCVSNAQWPEQIKLTASFGVAEMKDEAPAQFIARADKALYEAKARGRNRVIVSLEELETEISVA